MSLWLVTFGVQQAWPLPPPVGGNEGISSLLAHGGVHSAWLQSWLWVSFPVKQARGTHLIGWLVIKCTCAHKVSSLPGIEQVLNK